MNKLSCKPAAKVAAVILLCLMALLFLLSWLCLAELNNRDAFNSGYDAARQDLLNELGGDRLFSIQRMFFDRGYPGDSIYPNSILRFSVTRQDGEVLYNNYDGQRCLWSNAITVRLPYAGWTPGLTGTEAVNHAEGTSSGMMATPQPVMTGTPFADATTLPEVMPTSVPVQTPDPITTPSFAPTPVLTPTPGPVQVETPASIFSPASESISIEITESESVEYATLQAYILQGHQPADGLSSRLQLFSVMYRLRYVAMITIVLSFLCGIALFGFLMVSAGRSMKAGEMVVTGTWVERIPYDLYVLLCLSVFSICLEILSEGISNSIPGLLVLLCMALAIGLVLLALCMSTAVRIKTRSLWHNTLIVRLLSRMTGGIRWFASLLFSWLRRLPLLRRDLLIVLVLCFVEWFLLFATPSYDAMQGVLLVIKDLVLLAGITWLLLGVHRLREGASALARGDLSHKISTRHLSPELRDHANDLNHISDGIAAAVEDRLKSEKLRTELITNVSHDIKTPLTSIINYVDLMEKEAPESETLRQYLDVLSRQSAKLKKLIDDLIEASKASTGNLPVHAEDCDLNVLLEQVLGDYRERLLGFNLTPVVSVPDNPVVVTADGRHMWRIFDNLLNNILKYAQPGTRVYLDLKQQAGVATVSFRNISREPLNIRAEELTERFTRGDPSRSTEGNGLGLAIADSLTSLQGGKMELTLDGDLFKVQLQFPQG